MHARMGGALPGWTASTMGRSQIREEFDMHELISDPANFTHAYRTHATQLRGFVGTIIRDRHLAEDVVHEAFLELWKHPDRFDPARADLQSWLRTIAHRRAIDRIRSLEASHARDLRVGKREHAAVNHDTDQWDALFHRQELRAGLARLSDAQRDAVTLRYLAERTTIELADDLQVSVSTAKTRVRDGLLALHRHLHTATTSQPQHRTKSS